MFIPLPFSRLATQRVLLLWIALGIVSLVVSLGGFLSPCQWTPERAFARACSPQQPKEP